MGVTSRTRPAQPYPASTPFLWRGTLESMPHPPTPHPMPVHPCASTLCCIKAVLCGTVRSSLRKSLTPGMQSNSWSPPAAEFLERRRHCLCRRARGLAWVPQGTGRPVPHKGALGLSCHTTLTVNPRSRFRKDPGPAMKGLLNATTPPTKFQIP
jgi:hypothetical protein